MFFHTSENVKMIRKIFMAYNATENMSPHEYMEFYIEKYPEETNNMKLQWIVENFISINKHMSFLNAISSYFSNELTDEEQDYFMVYFHAVVFQLKTKFLNSLYKSIFNLNKNVLCYFIKFLSNNENLNVVSQIAEESYDTTYINETIIAPLFEWQPYISEMEQSYDEYIQKNINRNLKPVTVPVGPKFLLRKPQESSRQIKVKESLPDSQPVRQQNKMLSKSEIDVLLKKEKSMNKDKANRLLNEVKQQNYHFAQGKSDQFFKKIQSIQEERNNCLRPFTKTHKIPSSHPVQISHTVSSIKRINKHVHQSEQEEVKWLNNILQSCTDTTHVCVLEENAKKEEEKERMQNLQRKRLLGQISFEEAVLAKKNVQLENQKKYEDFLKERELWNEEIKKWRQDEMEKNRKSLEMLSLQELNLIKVKNDVILKKKEFANSLKQESDRLRHQIINERNELMEQKINMIKEIKILALIAKKSKVPKIIDLTETSGLGLLSEMSLAEVQERLTAIKIGLKEELETKQKQIKEEKLNNKKAIEEKNEENITYLTERAEIRKLNKERLATKPKHKESDEIQSLQNILNEKRKQRLAVTN